MNNFEVRYFELKWDGFYYSIIDPLGNEHVGKMLAIFKPDSLHPTETYLISVLEGLMNAFHLEHMRYARHTAKILGKLEVYNPEWDAFPGDRNN